MIKPYMSKWHEAMAIGAIPTNVSTTTSSLNELVSIILSSSTPPSSTPPRSTPSQMLERATIGSLYVATELFMLTDSSTDFTDTWSFLDNRIEELTLAGNALSDQNFPLALSTAVTSFGGAAISLAKPLSRSIQSNPIFPLLNETVVSTLLSVVAPPSKSLSPPGHEAADYSTSTSSSSQKLKDFINS